MRRHTLIALAAALTLAACDSSTAPELADPGSARMDEAAVGNGFGSGHGAPANGDGTQTTAAADSTAGRIGNGFGSGH
jgi:Spy/CpxP family protein refolding chaperone